MKRLIFFICVLFLLLDLADDGCLGKVKFVAPQSPGKYLEVSAKHYGPEAFDCHPEILPGDVRLTFPQSRGQPTKPLVPQSGKIVFVFHLSSAGGLPG
jgi:hypothetical protein